MTPSLEGWPTKAKETPSPNNLRLAPLDTNPVFECLKDKTSFFSNNCISLMKWKQRNPQVLISFKCSNLLSVYSCLIAKREENTREVFGQILLIIVL